MKTIDQLMNVDKAKIMFDLFRNEIPAFLEYTQAVADKVAGDTFKTKPGIGDEPMKLKYNLKVELEEGRYRYTFDNILRQW
jgi:hypothetical protein